MERTRRKILEEIFRAGVEAVDPEKAVRNSVKREGEQLIVGNQTYELSRFNRVFVIGVGEGTAPMAKALEDVLGDRLTEGRIVVKYGHGMPLLKTKVLEAGHPVPDKAGLRATESLVELAQGCTESDLVLFALSGGGSALLPAPDPPVDLEAKQQTTRLLLECGATIKEINAVRKHLSRVKGGRLARAAFPAHCVSLILSDVVGDELDVIASGPTVPDPSTFEDCFATIQRFGITDRLPQTVLDALTEGARGKRAETPKQDDPIFLTVHNVIVGNNRAALLAAEEKAREFGYATLVLTSWLQGEAREVAQALVAIGKEIVTSNHPLPPPACILAGGETTVTIRGNGRGGRNQELALAGVLALDGWERVALLSAGTDGGDGPTDAAGAFADGATYGRARTIGLDPHVFLAENDSYTFFDALGELLRTGPTRTNVMDLICILVD
ncbi:MAG: glycerate kinase [Deltaproteobacteria bacterium]|nr:MAG: glycerate kinase [Deltaproteobacteria bacterium]